MDDTMVHPDFWADIVRSQIAPFYGISDKGIIDELVEVPYAMPRGRVALMQRPLERTKKFVIYHGDTMSDEQKKQILSAFNLNEVFHAGLARFSSDEHENSIPYDTDRFLELMQTAKRPEKPIGKPRQPPR